MCIEYTKFPSQAADGNPWKVMYIRAPVYIHIHGYTLATPCHSPAILLPSSPPSEHYRYPSSTLTRPVEFYIDIMRNIRPSYP